MPNDESAKLARQEPQWFQLADVSSPSNSPPTTPTAEMTSLRECSAPQTSAASVRNSKDEANFRGQLQGEGVAEAPHVRDHPQRASRRSVATTTDVGVGKQREENRETDRGNHE